MGSSVFAQEEVKKDQEKIPPKAKPHVVFPIDGIPYAKDKHFRHGVGVDGSYYIPEHVPDVLQPMGKRPRGLLMRQIKTIPRVTSDEKDRDENNKVEGAVANKGSAAMIKKGKSVLAPKKEEEAVVLEEVTVGPFVDWLKHDTSAVEKAVEARKKYEKTKDLKPSYDKANRVFFEMRFPYSGVSSSGQKSDDSAVIYTTPKKE